MANSLFIVDDNALIRHLVRTCVENDPHWQVCGEAENGLEAVEKVRELKPDAVILDLQMPVMNGLEAAREIHAIAPETVMVMFTMHSSPQLLQEAQMLGIVDVLSKTENLAERLLPVLRQARA